MAIFERFRSLVQSKEWKGSSEWIPLGRVAPEPDREPPPFAADSTYLRLWLSDAKLDSSRKWFTEWHPAVHAAVSRNYGSTSDQQVAIIGPASIPGFERAARGSAMDEKALTPLLPFPGGTVSINVGLVAVKGDNVVRTLIDTVGSFGSMIPAAPIAAGVDIASKVVDAFESILGISGDIGTLAFDGTLTTGDAGAPKSLAPGYLAVLDSTPLENTLWARTGKLIVWDGGATSSAAPGNSLLLRLECRSERDDWKYLTDIDKALKGAQKAESPESRRAYYQQAIIAARTSTDLHEADRIRYAATLRDLRETDTGLGAVETTAPRNAEELADGTTMSVSDALELRPSLAALLAS